MPAFDAGNKPVKQLGSNMHSNRTRIHGKVLLFNKLNVRQKRIWLIDQCRPNSICSSEFLPYCSDLIDLRLLKRILETDAVTTDFIGMSTGTSNSQKRISPAIFLEYEVFVPVEIAEQTAIATILESMDEDIDALELRRAKALQIKQGMMQRLLMGKTRI